MVLIISFDYGGGNHFEHSSYAIVYADRSTVEFGSWRRVSNCRAIRPIDNSVEYRSAPDRMHDDWAKSKTMSASRSNSSHWRVGGCRDSADTGLFRAYAFRPHE